MHIHTKDGDALHKEVMKLHTFHVNNRAISSILPVSTPSMIDHVNGLNSHLSNLIKANDSLCKTNYTLHKRLVEKSKTVRNKKGKRKL